MEVSTRHMFLIVIGIGLYLYLTDRFKQPSTREAIKAALGSISNGSNHTIFDWIENKANSLAGLLSISTMAVVNQLPVGPDHKCGLIVIEYE